MPDYESLGSFYLGKRYDAEAGETTEDLTLYDAKDLTTHGVVVGMTGSGKTGLSVGVLEEAALDGIPSIVIDPKGDMGNLLLSFPELRGSDFEPWVDPAEATRQGKTVQELAVAKAELWRNGLASWNQQPERIRRYKDAVDIGLYTPGSSAGQPLSVLRSFDAPSEAVLGDRDALQERINSAVAGLLALLGIQADPVQSREFILLANLLQHAWSEGKSLDLAALIGAIQKPPFDKLGVIDLETFYPASDRLALAMRLNGILASPGFSAWLEGEPLDVARLLRTPDGKPRISIISIAHLSDSERMFVVTLLLNEVVSWMRSQAGTSSLRALLYMDEIFGYFPPTKAPPSKQPMLTLLKQARAFGLGVVLATQNPVDLDYKGLSNCGTWWIGRLQTERDKKRVVDGLLGAASEAGSALDRKEIDRLLSSLDKRVFLMNNVHEDGPELMQTRWVLNYLAGPLQREQIKTLTADRQPSAAPPAVPKTPPPLPAAAAAAATAVETPEAQARPTLPEDAEELFLPLEEDPPEGARVLYRPALYGRAQLHFRRTSVGVDDWVDATAWVDLDADARKLAWDDAEVRIGPALTLRRRGVGGARYAQTPAAVGNRRAWSSSRKALVAELYRTQRRTVYTYKPLKMLSEDGESKADFVARVQLAQAEQRDLEVEKLRAKFATKLASLEKRIATAEDRVEREESQLRDRKLQTAISFGSSLLGAVLGRKKISVTNARSAGTAIRNVGRSRREKEDVERASERVQDLLEEKEALEVDFEEQAEAVRTRPADAEVAAVEIPPLKTDIAVEQLGLAWAPWTVDADGIATPLFDLGS